MHRKGTKFDVLVEIHTESFGSSLDVLSIHGRRKAEVLELFSDTRGRNTLEALRPHHGACRKETAQFIAGIEPVLES